MTSDLKPYNLNLLYCTKIQKPNLQNYKYNKRCIEHKSINNKVRKNSKAVYRSMTGNNINAMEILTTEDTKSFWKNMGKRIKLPSRSKVD